MIFALGKVIEGVVISSAFGTGVWLLLRGHALQKNTPLYLVCHPESHPALRSITAYTSKEIGPLA